MDSVLSPGREENIAFHQKELKRPGPSLSFGSGRAKAKLCRLSSSPPRAVGTRATAIDPSVHAGVNIIKVKAAPGEFDCERLIAQKRIEPHPGDACAIVNVGTHVQLEKIREPGNARQAARVNPLHEKRHDREPALAIEGINEQSSREGLLDFPGFPLPMQEKELLPSHPQNGL